MEKPADTVLKLADRGIAGLQDAPLQLRRLADRLEADIKDYGEGCVCRVAVVVRFSRKDPMVFGYGQVESMPQVYMDLHAGAAELMSMRHPERS